MNLFEVRIGLRYERLEEANDLLLELGVEGWSQLEDVITKAATIVGIFPSRQEADLRIRELWPLLAPWSPGQPVVREMPDTAWKDSYKAHFHAWNFGRLHWVPIWEKEFFRLPAGHAVLWLDPGLAFGTGNHETTRLCVERLVTIAETEGTAASVTDAGCGSGILALSAAKLGFADVYGFDNDPEAVRVSRENAAMNALEDRVKFLEGDLITGFAGRRAGVVLANILADVLIRYAKPLTEAVTPGGKLVLSGILAAECDAVSRRFAEVAPDWAQDSRTLGEWSDLMLSRPLQ